MKTSPLALVMILACLLLSTGRVFADPPDTVVFQAGLLPANEVPPVTGLDTSGSATITLFVNRDSAGVITSGTVDFDVNFTGFPAGTQFIGLHIHNGDATVAGPVVIGTNLSRSNSVVSATGRENIFRRVVVNAGTPAANFLRGLVARPELYYVNLHTTVHPGGAIRGQLLPNRLVFRTLMSPDQEVPAVTGFDAVAVATTTIHVDRAPTGAIVSGTVDFDLAYQFPEIVTFTGFHIHRGAAGANGPVVISSGLGSGNNSITIPSGRGNLYRRADTSINAAALAALEGIFADPSQFYINLHTTVYPGGVVRGQLSNDSYSFLKTMLPLFEVPLIFQLATEGQALITALVDRDGTGNVTSGSVRFNIDFSIGAGATTFTGLHIHNGAEGTNGPIVISSGLSSDNTFPSDSGAGNITRTVSVADDIPAALSALRGLVEFPERYYVNLHTTTHPDGLLRSQLERTMLVYRLTMLPENEVPLVTGLNAAAAATIVARVAKNAAGNALFATVDFDVVYRFPPGTTFVGLHLHGAPAGVNGPVLISSGLSSPASVTDDDGAGVIFRRATIVPESTAALETLDAMATNPELFYANLHTTVHPGGAVRAQLATSVHYFAQAGGGGGNSTSISLTNAFSMTSASGFAYFFGPDGGPQETAVNQAAVPFVIPPGGTLTLITNSQAAIRSGYARVLTPDIVIPGFSAVIPGFAPAADGASTQNALAFRAGVQRNAADGTDAGVSAVNVSDRIVRAVFSLSDSGQAGGLLGRASAILSPGEQISRLLSELFPDLLSFQATLTVAALAPFPFQSIVATVVQLGPEHADIVPLEPVTKTAALEAEESQ